MPISQLSRQQRIAYIVLAAISAVQGIALFIISWERFESIKAAAFAVVVLLAIALLLVGISILVVHWISSRTHLYRQEETQRLRVYEEEYLYTVVESYESLRKAKHDYRNQLLIIQGMLRRNEINKLELHLHQLTGELASPLQLSSTGYTSIDAIITAKRREAALHQIEVEYHALIPEGLDALEADIAIILGNIWDNALAALQELPVEERRLRSQIAVQEGDLLIALHNPFRGSLRHSAQGVLSRRDYKRVGTGLRRVEQLAHKHRGSCSYGSREDKGQQLFSAFVLIPLPIE